MQLPIGVRPACASDAGELAVLARALAVDVDDPDPGDDPASLLATIFSPEPWCECLVADQAGAVVGFVLFCRRFEAHTKTKSPWIADLAVAATRRRQGVGDALLIAVRRRARELGAVSIGLEVWKGNHGALRFYDNAGATVLDDRHILHLMPGSAERR